MRDMLSEPLILVCNGSVAAFLSQRELCTIIPHLGGRNDSQRNSFKLKKRRQFSSARTTKRFPSLRCASAIQIVRPHESTAETRRRFVTQTLRICNLTRAPVGSYRIYEQREIL